IPGVEVDGNDVLAVYAACGVATSRARSDGGPTLLECQTYRTRPHAEGMGDFTYRTRDEVEAWKAKCPIERLRGKIAACGVATVAELDAVDAEVQREVESAHRAAEASPWPDPATAATHVYSEPRTPLTALRPSPRVIT